MRPARPASHLSRSYAMAAATGSLMTRRTDSPATPAEEVVTGRIAAGARRMGCATGRFDEGEPLRLCEVGRHGHHAVLDCRVREGLPCMRERGAEMATLGADAKVSWGTHLCSCFER
jgi:hypothetical protein